MSRRLPTARTSIVVVVSTKITRQSPTRNRAPGRPVSRLTLPAPVLANRSILAFGPHVRRKSTKLAAGIMSPGDRLHESNKSNRDDESQKNIAKRDIDSILSRPAREKFYF